MDFILQVGQKFRVPSYISQGLAKRHGQFLMVVEIRQLYRLSGSPLQPANGDIAFNLVEFPGVHGGPAWFNCYCMVIGSENRTAPELDHSPSLINSADEWFVPDLFRKQEMFREILAAGIVTFIEDDNELNPAPVLTVSALNIILERGYRLFVLQSYQAGMATDVKESLLITPYNTTAGVEEHLKQIRYDRRRRLYRASLPPDFNSLLTAAQQPAGYRIYCSQLPPERMIPSPRIKRKIDLYTRCNAPWDKGYKSAVVALQHGELGVKLIGPDGFIPWNVLQRY